MCAKRKGGWQGPLENSNKRYITEFDYAHPRLIVEEDIEKMKTGDEFFLVRKILVAESTFITWLDEERRKADKRIDM